MSLSFTEKKRIRKNFGRIENLDLMPELIQLQKKSYNNFLAWEADADPVKSGLTDVFKSVFPVVDYSGKAQLDYVSYRFEEPVFDPEECITRNITYAAPLRVTFRLIVWDVDEDADSKTIKDIKEQEVYMGDMPLMTDKGTFIVNGTERVIVSQVHRSPGVFFDHDGGKTHASGKYLFSARVIPYRGSWLDFEFDPKDLLHVRIDRKRKLPATTFLMALDNPTTAEARAKAEKEGTEFDLSAAEGYTREELLNYFYNTKIIERYKKAWRAPFVPEAYKGVRLESDLINAKTGDVAAEAGKKLTIRAASKLKEEGLDYILLRAEDCLEDFVAKDIMSPETGEVLAHAGDEVTEDLLNQLVDAGIKKVELLDINFMQRGAYLRNTLQADKNATRQEALEDIYRILRPGEPATLEGSDALFRSLFFDFNRYDLSTVGRLKINSRLGGDEPLENRVLTSRDVLEMVRMLLNIKDGFGEVDDIDNLANRRVRSVGELIENQYRGGLLKMEKVIKERMGTLDLDSAMPNDLINARPASAAVKEFFGTSQLSQFMDQTNPLSEITHKRRLSALGPGGLTRDRASFEVRDVHPTHYGRICPIETPEGPNIGLINSLSTYAKVNEYGFIETPYRLVKDNKVGDEVVYMSAIEEANHTIAQANVRLKADGSFADEFVSARRRGEFVTAPATEITSMDVSPKQLVSVASALIPFLENDDAKRVLMGANMQRQALPLLKSEAPLVGTGMERIVAADSGAVIVAARDGVVDQADGDRIVVRVTNADMDSQSIVDIYTLQKFKRSNHNTCINQTPLVKVGDHVKKGDIIADGPAVDTGELGLGKNVLVGFMPWHGYGYEDSVILSERISRDDVYTSIHIEEFEIMSRDTKLGNEEVTRDIPNVSDEVLKHLDEAGIVALGAEVKPGDILVGRVTPKGESPITPEEKLLRAIFGEKASDVRDTSLRVPPGCHGTVVDVRVFSRRGVEKDERALAIEQGEVDRLRKDYEIEREILDKSFYMRLREGFEGQELAQPIKGVSASKKGMALDKKFLSKCTHPQLRHIVVDNAKLMDEVATLKTNHEQNLKAIREKLDEKVEKVRRGDELAPGVLKTVKVFVAVKRKIQPGDKMAGRHGNKGVVATVVPLEDMPHLEDGTPLDIILNPHGLPSRMNVGQILETNLGWAGMELGKQVGRMVDEIQAKNSNVKALREKLADIYESEDHVRELKAMSDAEILELGANLRKGVPMATPVFDGAKEADINRVMEKAGLPTSGQVRLIDGRSGEYFDREVTVGCIYMLKLHHLVDEKIHARSIGPYSLVTQQPLGGKAQFGGQRFGEMEVWALQAYGAAYTLQEMLTLKSDDVAGRTKVYESIIRGDDNFEAGVPESFNVLVKELQALGLNVDFGQSE